MDRELAQDYLERSGMKAAQADALSRILAEMATKSDLLVLEKRIENQLLVLEKKLEALESKLTWRIISAVALIATAMTLVTVFAGWLFIVFAG